MKHLAQGALLGSAVGDAIGVSREFMDVATQSEMDHVMQMPGGGVHNAAPGAVTDDTELQISQLRGLLEPVSAGATMWDNVAKWYCAWARSHPFDMGRTCSMAFMTSSSTHLASRIGAQAKASNMYSKANGQLMRCTPLVIFAVARGLSVEHMVTTDCLLSHPNPTCIAASLAFASAMAHLFQNPGDAAGATRAAKMGCKMHSEVTDWLAIAQTDCALLDVTLQEGYVKWAIILTFWHLRQSTPYVAAIRHVVGRGGDADTNAAIVGAMMGALHGIASIPPHFVRQVVQYDPKASGGYPRPDWVLPRHLPALLSMVFPVHTML